MRHILKISAILVMSAVSSLASESQKAMLSKIQNYLNGVKSLQADMIQINPDQTMQKGRIFMRRDANQSYGKLRLEYQPPASDLIVVDGEDLQHKDLKTKEITSYSVENTPASFLLKKNLRFGEDMQVQSVHQDGNLIHIKLVNIGDAEGMSLTLDLTTSPFLKLVGWQVYDGQGNHTSVKLENVQIDIHLNDALFKMN